ncbi:MAG: phosphoribosylaminoimidazolesuccinocarboxamide synthase [Planctomycetota bacterium]
MSSEAESLYHFDDAGALMTTSLPLPKRSGKVRDVYDLGDSLLIISTDRISAFDHILPSGIPGKGELLTGMSVFWFEHLPMRHHLLSTDVPNSLAGLDHGPLRGRTMVVEKAEVIPFECVARGFLEGSGWREYQRAGSVCGVMLPPGLRQCDRLVEPIFTPATKAVEGHDENISFVQMVDQLGIDLARQLREETLRLYQLASKHAAECGLLIADTKFEFGRVGNELVVVDEVLTPDSSRFWDADVYQPGGPQPSFDKQFVREWLSETQWDKESAPPALPHAIIERTAAKYREAYERMTRRRFGSAESS